MAIILPKDPTILALPTMTSVLEFQVKRLENERTKADKVFNETLQEMQATINSQQACIAQLKAENLTLRHQSEAEKGALQSRIIELETALKKSQCCEEKSRQVRGRALDPSPPKKSSISSWDPSPPPTLSRRYLLPHS